MEYHAHQYHTYLIQQDCDLKNVMVFTCEDFFMEMGAHKLLSVADDDELM